MDTELLIGIAQILTGIATLVVAIFLAGQLVLQRRSLAVAHQDAQRELAFSSRNTINSILLARLTSDGLASVVSKGFENMDNLTESSDRLRFTGYMRQCYQAFIMEWILGGEQIDKIEFKERIERMFVPLGGRQYYLQTGREIVKIRSQALTQMFDELYEIHQTSPIAG